MFRSPFLSRQSKEIQPWYMCLEPMRFLTEIWIYLFFMIKKICYIILNYCFFFVVYYYKKLQYFFFYYTKKKCYYITFNVSNISPFYFNKNEFLYVFKWKFRWIYNVAQRMIKSLIKTIYFYFYPLIFMGAVLWANLHYSYPIK